MSGCRHYMQRFIAVKRAKIGFRNPCEEGGVASPYEDR